MMRGVAHSLRPVRQLRAMKKMTKNDWMYKVLDLKLEIAKADDDLKDLRSYLLSDKFHADSTVQVSDVLRRLEGVKLYSTTEHML